MPLMIPLLIWCGWRLGGRWRWAAWLLVPPNVATIPILHAKAGLLGLAGGVAAVGYCWLLLRLAPRLRRAAICLTVALVVGVSALVISRLPAPPYKGADSLRIPVALIDAHRQVIWGFSVRFADDRPLFGYGLDTAGRFPGAKAKIPGFGQEYVPGHTHNWIIQLVVEAGWIGLLLTLVAIALLLRRIWRGIVDGHSGAWVAAAGTGAFFLSSLVNFNLWAVWWQGIFYLLLALSLAAVPRRVRTRAPSAARPAA
jgi:O-antigen ligase